MKASKNYLVGLIVLLGTTNFTIAQEEPQQAEEVIELKHMRAKAHHNPLSKIKLEESQQVEVDKIRLEYQLKLQEIRNDENILEEDKRSTFQALKRDQRVAIRKVLTEEQIAELKEQQLQRKNSKANLEYKRPSSDEMAARYIERLDQITSLDEVQKEQLTQIYKTQFAKKQEIWKNADLSKEQKTEEFKVLKSNQDKEVRKILNKKQIKALEEYKKTKAEKRKKK